MKAGFSSFHLEEQQQQSKTCKTCLLFVSNLSVLRKIWSHFTSGII